MGKHARVLGRNTTRLRLADGSWFLDMVWAEVDGRAECIGVSLRSHGPMDRADLPDDGDVVPPAHSKEHVRPIRAEVLRQLTIGAIEEARSDWAEFLESKASAYGDPAERIRARAAFAKGRGHKLVGANGEILSPLEALAQVAEVYRQAWRSGGNPTQTVADTFAISRSAAAKRVRRARDTGLLPETTRGKARGGGD